MFIGHYIVSFAIKKKAPQIPLWTLFIAVQFVDIIWAVLIVIGIEKISYNLEASFFLRSIYEYYPYSHSLFTNIILAVVVYLVIRKCKGKTWALWLSLAVLSHWFLDIIVHTPDIPLIFNKYKIGFGLWKYPLASIRAEIILLGIGATIYLWGDKLFSRKHIRTIIFLLVVFGLYMLNYFTSAIEPSPIYVGVFSITLYLLIAVGGWWIEREKKNKIN